MTNFLFWNLNGHDLASSVSTIVKKHNVDVLLFVEFAIPPVDVLAALNEETTQFHYSPGIGCKKVVVFTRFPTTFLRPIFETHRLSIRHLKLPGLTDILLAIVHFPSKRDWDERSQAMECAELSRSIRSTEDRIGHSRTILVGDLNMNPFEDGVVSANGLHGVMTRGIAQKRVRTVQSKEYPMFYNPMWGLFGDNTPGPAGSYYYRGSAQRVFFWNMFDQVLVRPELVPSFNVSSLAILSSDGSKSLLTTDGLPDVAAASDHLPIVFRVEL